MANSWKVCLLFVLLSIESLAAADDAAKWKTAAEEAARTWTEVATAARMAAKASAVTTWKTVEEDEESATAVNAGVKASNAAAEATTATWKTAADGVAGWQQQQWKKWAEAESAVDAVGNVLGAWKATLDAASAIERAQSKVASAREAEGKAALAATIGTGGAATIVRKAAVVAWKAAARKAKKAADAWAAIERAR